MNSSLNKTSGCRRSTLEAVLSRFFLAFKFAVPFASAHCRAGTNAEVGNERVLTQIAFTAHVLEFSPLSQCQQHTTCNKGVQGNWSDTLIAAQVQYRLGHYYSRYTVATNNSICTLYESAITYKSVNYCEIRVTHLFPFSLSRFLSKWATGSRWHFIVYVFIHCEAGITGVTRSFKQMSEYSIDWNVNTGSHWAPVTQLKGTAAVFLVLHCQPEEQKCFSQNCWLSCSSPLKGLGMWGNGKPQNEMLILILKSKTEGTFQFILNKVTAIQ